MDVIRHLKSLSDERFLEIYTALEQKGYGPLDGEVAKALRFRPHAIKQLPMNVRAKRAKGILERGAQAQLCYEIFGAYLMKNCKNLVTGFLDATGVAHEEGMIDNVEANAPAAEKLEETVAALDRAHDPRDVSLYLSLACEQWPQVERLKTIMESRA